MPKVLAAYVHVTGEDGDRVVLTPGEPLPKWAENQVTNPDAFVQDGEPVPVDETAHDHSQYTDLPFKTLQAEAKSRGLSGGGDHEALIARLEADDRETGDN